MTFFVQGIYKANDASTLSIPTNENKGLLLGGTASKSNLAGMIGGLRWSTNATLSQTSADVPAPTAKISLCWIVV
jgi:hypothetical protein